MSDTLYITITTVSEDKDELLKLSWTINGIKKEIIIPKDFLYSEMVALTDNANNYLNIGCLFEID